MCICWVKNSTQLSEGNVVKVGAIAAKIYKYTTIAIFIYFTLGVIRPATTYTQYLKIRFLCLLF